MQVNGLKTNQIHLLPSNPGVYKFFNKNDKIIYVGKAKNLRKRVASYFNKTGFTDRKTHRLISEIRSIQYTVVNSEFDAFLLENNLIKENQPKYNIQLRDDKSFPFICVTRERFPRIYSTRRVNKEKGNYYGPYSSVVAMNSVLELIRNLYTIRTCKLNLSEKNIISGKFKVCLEYHIGNCKGPCEGLQDEDSYLKDIEHAVDILKGDIGFVEKFFKKEMNLHANNLQYEKAQMYKEKLALLEKFQSRTMVVNKKLSNADVFTILSDENIAYVNYIRLKNGGIIASQTREIKKKLNEKESDILTSLVLEIQKEFEVPAAEIITNIPLEICPEDYINTIPVRGDKRKLVELSLKNVFQLKKEKQKLKNPDVKDPEKLIKLKEDLHLPDIPSHIECFDNSNFQGTNPVASMVCFINGRPSKKNYRHFNIRSVTGPDDFASMKEIVQRRYKRLKEEGAGLPNLVIIDGGKGQLNAAIEALKSLSLYGKMPIISVAKRLEEIYTPNDELPLHISKSSPSLKLIQQVRDEAHRFAITFHRNKRSKNAIKLPIEDLKGIGPKTISILLNHFKSIRKAQQAPVEELINLIGKSKAEILKKGIKKEE